MKRALLLLGLLAAASISAFADDGTVETIVFLRHGEKPESDLGQLAPKGLNRALALPKVLERYGKPAAIFAPLTSLKGGYSYVRPLATIEPTAIRLGMPVRTPFAFDEIDKLEAELLKPEYQSALIFVAWEHHLLEQMVRNFVRDLHGTETVDAWPGEDFDSIYRVVIRTADGTRSVEVKHEQEGLSPSADLP